MQHTPLSYIEISKSNLVHNYKLFQAHLPQQTKIAIVIKGNAYGHGMNEVVKILEPYVEYWQIDDIEELQRLRNISSKISLLLGYVANSDLGTAVQRQAELAMYDVQQLEVLNAVCKQQHRKIKIHLKIDALLGREGLLIKDLANFLLQLKRYPAICLTGVYSHFSNLEDTTNLNHAHKQIAVYRQAIKY